MLFHLKSWNLSKTVSKDLLYDTFNFSSYLLSLLGAPLSLSNPEMLMFPRPLRASSPSLGNISFSWFQWPPVPMTYKPMDQANLSPQLRALPNVFQWISIYQMLKPYNMFYMVL